LTWIDRRKTPWTPADITSFRHGSSRPGAACAAHGRLPR
jgi:hypothetical protein